MQKGGETDRLVVYEKDRQTDGQINRLVICKKETVTQRSDVERRNNEEMTMIEK